jgi:CRP-like cAMP-binding protein
MTEMLELAADLPLLELAPGDVLIDEGALPGRMFVLASGSVTVERDGVAFARIDAPGAIFGEMSVVLGQPATATVRAATALTVHVVDDPEAFLVERPGAALQVLRMTASRLDGLTQYLVDVKAQFADEQGHLGMVGEIVDTLINHQAPAVRTGSLRDPEGDHVH